MSCGLRNKFVLLIVELRIVVKDISLYIIFWNVIELFVYLRIFFLLRRDLFKS